MSVTVPLNRNNSSFHIVLSSSSYLLPTYRHLVVVPVRFALGHLTSVMSFPFQVAERG
jgi:hypothetical protein